MHSDLSVSDYTKKTWNSFSDEGSKLGIFPFVLSLVDENLNEAFLYASTLNRYQQEIMKRYRDDDHTTEYKNLRAMDKNFKVVYMADEALLVELEKNLKAIFGSELKYILAPEAYMGCHYLTLLHPDADKSHGIQSVSEAVGFDLQKLTVFGDNYNDIGMFALANISVAVANAQDGVKKEADIVLPHTNDEDGVARYLQGIKNAT